MLPLCFNLNGKIINYIIIKAKCLQLFEADTLILFHQNLQKWEKACIDSLKIA